MLISASRRTDIPTYYAPWFRRRIEAGYVLVRNPRDPRQVSRIDLRPEVVDGIVFWTKNPIPLLPELDALRAYCYVFQFTLTAYGRDVEPNLPSKGKVLVPAFQRLADQIGPDRVLWRYDPIFLSRTYTPEYHLRYFAVLARRLRGYTRQCTISFLDQYPNTVRNMAGLGLRPFPTEEKLRLAKALAEIATGCGIRMTACAEPLDLTGCGIAPAHCVDAALFERLLGCELELTRDRGQRPACGCAASVDIGAYHTCGNGCRYCYANDSRPGIAAPVRGHAPDSPLLVGGLGPGDVVTERRAEASRSGQLRLGD